MKAVICNYTGYRENWGSQATSRGLVQLLQDAFGHLSGFGLDILPYPPTHWLDHWQARRHGSFLNKIYAETMPTAAQLSLLERLCEQRFGALLDRIRNANVVFFQGEGALGNGREFERTQILGPLYLAKHLYQKPVISINQTISFQSATAERSLAAIFGNLDLNYVREFETLEKCNGPIWQSSNLKYCPDAAFFYRPYQLATPFEAKHAYFCVTGSASLKSYDLESYARGVQAIALHWGLRPVFVYSRSGDAAIAHAYKSLGNPPCDIITAQTHPDVDQILPILAGAQVVLGGRYHTSISALAQHVPVILTASNSHKSAGLAKIFKDVDIPFVAAPSRETLQDAMAAIMLDRPALVARLKTQVADIRVNARKVGLQIHAHLGERAIDGKGYGPTPELSQHTGPKMFRTISRTRNLAEYDRARLLP